MKRNQKILVTAVLGAVSALALNTVMAADALSIKDTPHNLGSGNLNAKTPSGTTPANHSNDTAEICVFCHTPHGGDNSAAVPIWNRKLGISGTGSTAYVRYAALGTTTFDAQEVGIGSVSIACLSCHDGTQAIDSVINAPGSGGYNPAGARMGTGNFVGGDTTAGTGKLGLGNVVVQNLGTDLSNDHPISMQFGGGGVSITTPAPAKTFDPDFRVPAVMNAPVASGLQKLWYIELPATTGFVGDGGLTKNSRDREDVILYTRTGIATDLATLQPTVECGSCHDPHNYENPTFLRIANSGPTSIVNNYGLTYTAANGGPSALCLTCHIK